MPVSKKLFILGYSLWWLFWMVVQALVLHRLGQSWQFSLIDAAVSALLLALLVLSALLLFRYYRPGKKQGFYRFFYALVLAIFYCFVLDLLLKSFIPGSPAYNQFLESSMPLRFIFSLLLLQFAAILNWMHGLLQEEEAQIKRRNEAAQLAREAELVRLRQQLQPHFLFNSLNSISALVGSDSGRARQMIQQLSDFLRGTVKKEKEELVTLGEEIAHLSLYLEIEKVRFGNRLRVELEMEPGAENKTLPPLLLQPLAENAIKFAVYGRLDEVHIKIEAKQKENFLEVIIENPFEAAELTPGKGTGFGLSSIHRRLMLLYGRTDLLTTNVDKNIFRCRLLIPQ